jgi:hypothetical protein
MTINVGEFVLLGVLCAFAWWAWGVAGVVAIVLAWALARVQGRLA